MTPEPSSSPENSSESALSVSRLRNLLVAVAAIILSAALFFGLRTQSQAPSLNTLAANSTPYETALVNDKPTLIEFYANWCTSCQTMAPLMADLETQYGDRLNFVMLNVDNDKWLPELMAYQVDGIPEFVFLDGGSAEQGQAIGEQTPKVMQANLEALLAYQPIPYANRQGRVSVIGDQSPSQTGANQTDPRSHGAQVVGNS